MSERRTRAVTTGAMIVTDSVTVTGHEDPPFSESEPGGPYKLGLGTERWAINSS